MNVYFWQRSQYMQNKYEIPGDLKIKLERYSKVWFGGCDEAELSIEGSKESLLLLLNLARAGISIHTEGAVPLWWGYVSRIEVEIDGIMATVDFENMANDIAVAYTLVSLSGNTIGIRQTTDWLKDVDSVAEYGDRQLLESGASMNAVAAAALVNQKLASLKLPKLVVTTRRKEGKNRARIICKGWQHLLEGRYCAIPTKLALAYETFGTEVVSFKTEEKWAQSFIPTSDTNLAEVGVYVKRVGGAPGYLSVALFSNVNGKPGTSLASGSLNSALIGTDFAWNNVMFSSAYALTTGTKYFIVISASGVDENNYYEFPIDMTEGYLGGKLSLYYSSDWVRDSGSILSTVYSDANVVDTSGIGNAVEHKLGLTRAGIGQDFKTGAYTSIYKVAISVKKVGNPGNITVNLIRNIDTLNEANLGSATILAADVTTDFTLKDAVFSTPIAVTAGETLTFTLSSSGTNEANYYVVQVIEGEYVTGTVVYRLSSDWIERKYDAPFRLYSNVLVETTQQIQNYLTQYGVFTAIRMEVLSGIFTESFRNGDTTAYSELQAHQENGTSNYRRILSRVNLDRTVDVWEQPAEPTTPDIEYRTDGKIYYMAGSEIEPGYDPVGKWVSVLPITKSGSYFSAINGMNNYFVDACEWDADGRPSIKPADWKNPNAVRVQNG